MPPESRRAPNRPLLEICILAGGLSTRMGRDKAALRLGRRSMISLIRATALTLTWPVRVLRRDQVPRCGPLGGMITALQTTRAQAVLFLACDMPLVSPALLQKIVARSRSGTRAVFVVQGKRVGFPLLLPAGALADVQSQIAHQARSIHQLAAALAAHQLRVAKTSHELCNVNSPEDGLVAEKLLRVQSVET